MSEATPPALPLVKHLHLAGSAQAHGRGCPVCGGGAPCRVGFDPGDTADHRPVAGFCTTPAKIKELGEPDGREAFEGATGWTVQGGPVVAYATAKDKGVRGVVAVAADVVGPGQLSPRFTVEIPAAPDPHVIWKAKGIKLARKIWAQAKEQTPEGAAAIRSYLATRGIPVDRLPGFENGAVPRTLRFHPRCWIGEATDSHGRTSAIFGPAMLARLDEVVVEQGPGGPQAHLSHVGLQRYFLAEHEGRWIKRVMKEEDDSSKKMIGSCKGRTVWPHKPDSFPRGALIVGEGLETVAACGAATGLSWQPALMAESLQVIHWYENLFRPRSAGEAPPVSCIIWACDLNRHCINLDQLEKFVQKLCELAPGLTAEEALAIAKLPTGQRAGMAGAAIVRSRWPWITNYVRWPSAAHFPELVKIHEPLVVEQSLCVDRPIDGKSVDWLNCLNLGDSKDIIADPPPPGAGSIEERVGRVAKALLDGVDFELAAETARCADEIAASARAALRDRATRALGVTAAYKPQKPIGDDRPVGPKDPGPIGESPAARGGGGAAPPTRPGIASGGQDDPKRVDKWLAVVDAARAQFRWSIEPFPRPCIDPQPRNRARLFLLEQCLDTLATRFRLLFWAEKYFWCTGGRWAELSEDKLFGWVQDWLQGFDHQRDLRTKDDVQPVKAGIHEVNEVLAGLREECRVEFKAAPVWLPENLLSEGEPLWVRSGQTRLASERHNELGRARDWIVYADCMLSLRALRERRDVAAYAVAPELFTMAARPYALDIESLRGGLAPGAGPQPGGVAGLSDAWLQSRCPSFARMLDLVGRDEFHNTRDDRAEFLTELQKMYGDINSADRTIEYVGLLQGYGRSGKDSNQRALTAMVGRDMAIEFSVKDLEDDDKLAAAVGKSLILFPDMQVSSVRDNTLAGEVVKKISGNSGFTIRGIYQRSETGIRFPGRVCMFCNDIPEGLKDSSGVLARRFAVFPLKATVQGNEDGAVKEGIDDEGAAINVWALIGYYRLWSMPRPRVVSPPSGDERMGLLERNVSPIKAFIRDCCVEDQGTEVTVHALYQLYRQWCHSSDRQPVSQDTFVSRIQGAAKVRVPLDEAGRPTVIQGICQASDLPAAMTYAGEQRSAWGGGPSASPAAPRHVQHDLPI